MLIRKNIENSELRVHVDDKLVWKRDLESGLTTTLDEELFRAYCQTDWRQKDYSETPQTIRVRARMKLTSTAEGGHTTGLRSGVRPNHVFEEFDHDQMMRSWVGEVHFDQTELFLPGDERDVTVHFLFHCPIDRFLEIGRRWWIHAGRKRIGDAEIAKKPNHKPRTGSYH